MRLLSMICILGCLHIVEASAQAVCTEEIDPPLKSPANTLPQGRAPFLHFIQQEAERQNMPAALAEAVAYVESAWEPQAVGSVGEFGLMQVRLPTARMLGFSGQPAELFRPEVNIRYGVLYLAQAWRLTNGDLCRTLTKYRAGHGEDFMTPLSIAYCAKARAYLAKNGSPLAKSPVPVAVAQWTGKIAMAQGSITKGSGRRPRWRQWAQHTSRLRAIEAKLTTTSFSIMAR